MLKETSTVKVCSSFIDHSTKIMRKKNFRMRIMKLIFCMLIPAIVCSPLIKASANEPLPGPRIAAEAGPSQLPARYFWLMESATDAVEARLKDDPNATLEKLDEYFKSIHFPFSILAPAVFYSKKHPANKRYRDPRMLKLAFRIGDLMAEESKNGNYESRADSDWEIYMWLETYRLLLNELGAARKILWEKEILKNVQPLEEKCTERINFAWYNTPYTGTSPNHYSIYASIIYIAGEVFNNERWKSIGKQILHRFATEEQSPDGYWGELVNSSPTIGYNHLTLGSVALYWEHSGDTSVLPALRRATDFHKYFTYPNGEPVEVMNDRNRHWGVSPWGMFAFTNYPDGRRYAQFLTSFFTQGNMDVNLLGRMAQNALYYHEGQLESIPQDQPEYSYRTKEPAGINKNGPWVVALSGLISPKAVINQFYLDRQSHISIFHEKLGLIITGANSKRQPELATFHEKLQGEYFHIPISSRLQMGTDTCRLSLAYNSFFADMYMPTPSEKEVRFRFVISGVGKPSEDSRLNLQLCLKDGETLETATGRKIILGTETIELSPQDIGGWIRHHGWTLNVDPAAKLTWPVYPFNPYQNKLETSLKQAVGVLSVPVQGKEIPGNYVRPNEQEISFVLKTD
jgi:hypothetical protein